MSHSKRVSAVATFALLIAGSASAATNLLISSDPDWNVAATGGVITAMGPSAVLNTATLANFLAAGDVIIRNNTTLAEPGDISIVSPIAWQSPSSLRIEAVRDIVVASTVSATRGAIVLRADSAALYTSGSTARGGTVIIGAAGALSSPSTDIFYNPPSYSTPTSYAGVTGTLKTWMLVNDAKQLQGIQLNLAGSYALGCDIDAAATGTWNNGAGFVPIGSRAARFTGQFNGDGRTITSLVANRPANTEVGVFGIISGGSASNVTFEDVTVIGGSFSGVLGALDRTNLSNITVTGARVTGVWNTGGLAGQVTASTIDDVVVRNVTVVGAGGNGGAFGVLASSTVSDMHVSGSVSSSGSIVGGFAAQVFDGVIQRCSSSASVTATEPGRVDYGGLIGLVTTTDDTTTATIADSFASGTVSGPGLYAGGLIGVAGRGLAAPRIRVRNCYSVAAVVATGTGIGGLIGANSAAIVTSSYWDTETSGFLTSDGGVGKTDAEMRKQATFAGWDFTSTWTIAENAGYPLLHRMGTPSAISAAVPPDGLYGPGQALELRVTFSEPVVVSGRPSIALVIGAKTVAATYASGSGTTTLLFRYVVQPDDRDMDGISLADAIALNGGTIRDSDGNSALLALAGVPPTAGVRVGTSTTPPPLDIPALDARALALLAAALASAAWVVMRER